MEKRDKREAIKYLPQEIIEEILTNLPVKSLLRFKSVSKAWQSLICSDNFTKSHLKKSSHYTNHRLMMCIEHRDAFQSLRSCSLKFLYNDPEYKDYCTITSFQDHRIGKLGILNQIVGSCNGLVLLYVEIPHGYDLILWNPSTRQVGIIPPPPLENCIDLEYGFGYDDSTHDYKIVSIGFDYPHETWMYSLRTGSWKKINNFEEGVLGEGSGKCLNGMLHWTAVNGKGVKNIVSLDLVKGKYHIVPPPKELVDSNYLDVLGGYLSVVSVDSVWVLKKYGNAESWAEIPMFSYFGDVVRQTPMWLEKNGDVAVAISRSRVILYNRNSKTGRSRVYEVDDGKIGEREIYVESLVSPFSGQELC